MDRIVSAIKFLAILLLAPVVCVLPQFKKKIVFGAWEGNQFSDNPKYFMKYLLANTDYECIWIGRKHVASLVAEINGAKFAKRGSLLAAWHMATASYMVCNINWWGDIMYFPNYSRSKCINFWHGTALKKIGDAQFNGAIKKIVKKNGNKSSVVSRLRKIRVEITDWAFTQRAYTTCASERMRDILHAGFPIRFDYNRTIVSGQPRNDFLIQNMNNEALKKELKDKYGKLFNLPVDKKWYLYMPTWRHDLKDTFSFLRAEMKAELQKILEDQDAILIEKQHPIILKQMNLKEASEGQIYVLASKGHTSIDMQELLLASDRLITDYSSCFFDFEIMKRPTIHFAYDYENYANRDSGVEYDLKDIAAGPIVKNERELVAELQLTDDELWSARALRADATVVGETGHACETFARWIGLIK